MTPAPLIVDARPARTGVEIRPLDERRSLLTVGERHHIVDVPAAVVQVLVWAWHEGRDDLVGAEFAAAAEGLRPLLAAARPDAAPPGTAAMAYPPAVRPATGPAVRAVLAGDDDVVTAARARLRPDDDAQPAPEAAPRTVATAAFSASRLLVVALRGGREREFVDLDRICHDLRVPWLPVELSRGRLWVGPLVTPGVGASYEDAAARRLASARNADVHRALRTPAVGGDQGPDAADLPGLLDAMWELAAAAAEAVAGAALDEAPGDVVHELWLDDGEVRRAAHPVLPLPHRRTRHRPHGVDDLIDERTGVITRIRDVRHHGRVPSGLVTRQADVADIRAVTSWANNVLCQGSAFDDADSAHHAAVGESVERYCGNILDTLPVRHGSFAQLRRAGVPALDPRRLVLYSEQQYAAPGFPFVPLDADLPVHWVPGRSALTGREVWVPASLVYVNWYSADVAAAPPTNFCAFAGIAAGPSEDFAVTSAIEEVVERHATMVWWLNAQPLPRVEGVPTPPLAAGTRASFVHLDNEFDVPVAAAIVHDDDDALVNVGFSARPDFASAASKALTEAYTLQEGSRDLLHADGLHWRVMTEGELNGRAFKPWRADRRYLDDFRADMHDCDDLMVQQQVYLDPRAGRRMSPLLEPATTRSVEMLPRMAERSRVAMIAGLERADIEPIVVDITTPDVASAGLRVVRVIAPGTIGNAPAAFPFLGHGRVQRIAVELGWRDEPLPESRINLFPLPHA
ncbi:MULTISPECIES: TOMM precursor leader peptide-binding protein [Microbacterium]|uniref:TOMM precursor leader peptide-binding protein n=1 Tax=Microbacterium TaxID=33882 RepID=UPI0027845F5F|nr:MULTISPECIES: TOMM precursor leader peptide-binding protein [Microbacterium]MDQ1082225.1 ribosomal protein S12 methylthiotransferase accessory factor [Microbacterium sp. SORGH_AS_0344]MDQ1169004.1 ribosomal protein S12 methylthiotransferase accessory factor [Microbacterium proteolyticum]